MKKKFILVAISTLAVLTTAGALAIVFTDDEITFQSLESISTGGKPVFNTIKYIKSNGRDIWMMNQSHYGLNIPREKVDRLAIVITNRNVSFYQLKPGPLLWEDNLLNKQVTKKVSCLVCHNNGPRVVRPNFDSFDVGWLGKARIFFWNMKIKSYGLLKTEEKIEFGNKVLKVAACTKCHKNEGFFARGELREHNASAIEFMLKNKIMPPVGFSLSENELREVKDFVQGF